MWSADQQRLFRETDFVICKRSSIDFYRTNLLLNNFIHTRWWSPSASDLRNNVLLLFLTLYLVIMQAPLHPGNMSESMIEMHDDVNNTHQHRRDWQRKSLMHHYFESLFSSSTFMQSDSCNLLLDTIASVISIYILAWKVHSVHRHHPRSVFFDIHLNGTVFHLIGHQMWRISNNHTITHLLASTIFTNFLTLDHSVDLMMKIGEGWMISIISHKVHHVISLFLLVNDAIEIMMKMANNANAAFVNRQVIHIGTVQH